VLQLKPGIYPWEASGRRNPGQCPGRGETGAGSGRIEAECQEAGPVAQQEAGTVAQQEAGTVAQQETGTVAHWAECLAKHYK
jgi:hypothetical protein